MATRNTVSPSDFVRRMKTHWTDQLNNTSNSSLEALWGVMADTFNEAINGHAVGDTKWRVLEPATGTGKTQGLGVYSAMIADLNARSQPSQRTGILVVVRTIAQADEVTKAVNEIAGRDVALSRHSLNPAQAADCRIHDVLVITHSAYQQAVEAIYRGKVGKWSEFAEWVAGPRCLTIIDEAIDNIIEQYRVTSQDLRTLIGYVDAKMRRRHPDAVAAVEDLLQHLNNVEHRPPASDEKIMFRERHGEAGPLRRKVPLDGLLAEIKSLPLDKLALGKDSPSDRSRLISIAESTLRSAEAILAKWAYYNQSGELHTLNCAELLLPMEIPGPVVLDATASQNMLWELLGPKATRPSVPRGARSYQNVSLHVTYTSGLGKTSMIEKGRQRVERVAHYLETNYPDRSALLCVHKGVEAVALDLRPGLAEYAVAHWRAIDGRNDWQNFDTIAILGLPYLGTVWATNTFFALQGLKDDEWFRAPSWKGYKKVREVMETKQLTVSVIQAINRVRCRRPVDSEGGCHPVDVFIALPEDRRGPTILDNIRQEMPGIQIKHWDFELDGEGASVSRSEGYGALVSYMSTRLPGETAMNKIRTDLNWSPSKMKELGKVLRDPSHRLGKSLGALGVTFHHNDMKGRASKSWLTKAG